MRNTSFGDLAIVNNASREAVNMVSGHFVDSQKLALPSTGTPAMPTGTVSSIYKLHWVFFSEYSKLKLDTHKIDKLKSTNFDFSKYFYILPKSAGITVVANLGNPPYNLQTYLSGGNGEVPPYNSIQNLSGDFNPLAIPSLTSSILEARGLVFEDLTNLNPEQINNTFNYAEIQFISENFDLQNFNTALLQL
jgi:hypothetical protein